MENKLNAQNYYAVEFDPNLSIGANEEGEFYLYKDYLNIVNEILSQEGQAPLNFNLASQHIVDKRKNSANLDHYNSIRDEVENTMNSSTLWNKNVPSVQKEKTVNFWSDKLYAVTREVEKQTRGMNLSDNTKQTINELTGEYVKFLRPMWYNWATKENDEFSNSQADGLGKGFFDFASGITRGVDINLPELLGGGDTFWGDWSEDLRKRSEEMAQSTGMYNMSTDELLESKEYSKAFWVMMNHALTSLPQQIPSALSTIPALLGGGGPIGLGAMGLGLGAGYLQESGNFYEDVYDLYTQKRSRAKRLKNSMPESEFKERFGITVDMPDTKLGIGTFKTLDTIDDEQLRQMSEQLAQEYGGWSSGLELVNTIGDVWLGRNAGILKNALMKNPKLAAKQWFKLHWSRPYIQQMGTEGATEFGQEFVSEVKKQANLPEYEINQTQLWESGIIGAMYGTGFQGVSDVASRIRDRKTPRVKAPERDFQSYRKGNKELRQHSIIDNDIVVGLHADPMNFTRKVADHHDISEDEVRIRMAELAEIGGLEKGKAKAILRKHPSILESYGDWNDPFAKIEEGKQVDAIDDLPEADFEFEDPTLTGAYDENLNDPSDIDDPSVNAGLDIGDGHFDVNIEQQHINALKKKIEKLESIDDPNVITRNEKQAQIEQYRLEIEQLEKTLTPEKAQKKRHDSLIAKGKESDELGIVGQKIIVRTKGQNGKMGKILSYEGSNAKVKTNSGIYTISIRNLEFSNPTEAIVNFKKEASTKVGRRKQKSDSTSKNFILKFAKQQGIELTPEEKKLSAQKLKALVRSKKPKTAPAPKQTKKVATETKAVKKEWSRYKPKGKDNYEVSTQGDKRFSALVATLSDGRTIEEAYQVGVKGYSSIKEGKGKPPKDKNIDTYTEYKKLWQQWAKENPELLNELRKQSKGKVLTDKFANTDVSQARALAEILNEGPSPKKTEIEDPTVPDNLIDPEEEGTPTSENSLEQMEKLMAEAEDSDPIEEDIIPEKKKVNIVKKVVGKTLDDIVDKADKSDNIDLDDRVPGAPQVKLHGHERKKFEQSMEKMWKQIKNEHRLTNRHFADVANSLNDYFASTPLADAWRLWSQTKINKSGMRRTLSDFGEAIQRATGDLFSDGSIAGDEYQDRIESAIEHVRENIGIVEDSLGDEPMSVKDFTKISRSFFARYDFIINPAKLKEVYDTALKFIQQDAQTAYDKLVEYYSTEENGIYTLMPRRTLAEVLATNDKANIMFRRFFNSIHPDNSGTFNRGEEGQIVEWEFRMFQTASNLEDEKTKKGIKRNFAQFRATEEKGLNQQSRPQVGVLPFYTRFIKDALFSFVKGTDIMTPYNKIYGFLDTNQMWNLYRDELVKRNLVVVASRGEQDKMILTSLSEESSNAVKDISAYILEEVEKWKSFRKSDPDKWNYVSNFFKNLFDQSNLDTREQELVDHVFKGNYDLYREHWIAKHMALKKTFGSDYIFMKPETIMKRIKIPFTPVYTSDTLPDRRVMYFDARGAKLKIWDDRTNSEKIVELTQKIDGTMQYIGDGQTITSERVFAVDYPEHFGGFRNTKRAKTVQYNIDGDNVHMAKHQEMTLDLNKFQAATLVNNKGKEIAVIAQDQNTGLVNIVDMDGNDIDYLMSDDEAKIKTGNYDKYDTIHLLPGKSIGMIQFTPDSQKNKSKFSTQLSYYFDDQNFQNKIINKYVTLDQGAFSPMNLMTKLIDWNSSGDKINNLIRTFTSRYFDVVPQNVEELGNLGVGRHPTVFPFLRDILKKKMLKPMADFIMDGSHLDFRADFQGRVSQSETIIGPNNFYIKKALKKMGKQKHIYRDFNEKIADINEWLKTNRLYTMITRSPIASSVGFGIYDIKEIDPGIGDSFILHPKEVKERFEGDQDHDTGHLTYIDEEFYEDIHPYMQKTQGLNITQYSRDTLSRDISTLGGTISMIRDMTYGETAIGEVVNAARYAGVMNSMFGGDGEIKLMVRGEERRFKIRPLDMQVVDRNIKKEDGEVFKGELKELLRLYLQASVDHPKVLLLRDWEYTQNNLFANLFYEPSSPLSKIDEDIVVFLKSGFINEVLRLNQEMDNMRKGAGESIKFQEIFDKSAQYSQFISDREGYLIKVYEELSIEDELPEGASEPITFIGANFKEGARGRPTSLQELITIIPDRALDKSGVPVERWFNVDSETSRGVHRETLRQIKDEIELIAQEENNGKQFDYTNAKMYAQKLSEGLSELFANKRNKNEQDTDENSFLNRMTPKTWDYSDDFIAFYKKWSQEFAKLSKPEQTIASLLFINGVATGLRSHQQLDLRQIPPIKEIGPSTLDSDVMKLYFEKYNNNLDEAYKDSDRLKEMRDVKPSQLVNEQKGAFNCG